MTRRPRRRPTGLCRAGRSWSQVHQARLLAMVEERLTYAEMGRIFGRSSNAIRQKIKKLLGTAWRWDYTAAQTARLLQVDEESVLFWIAQGWLTAVPGRTRRGHARHGGNDWAIEWLWLCSFLETEEYWVLYDPARITDPKLREWAVEIRAGRRFLGAREVGRLIYYCPKMVRDMCATGRLRGIRLMAGTKTTLGPWGQWWVRDDWLDEFMARQRRCA